MAVVINEFEVVPEAAPAERAERAAAAPEPTAPPSPTDVERALDLLRQRALRLRAD